MLKKILELILLFNCLLVVSKTHLEQLIEESRHAALVAMRAEIEKRNQEILTFKQEVEKAKKKLSSGQSNGYLVLVLYKPNTMKGVIFESHKIVEIEHKETRDKILDDALNGTNETSKMIEGVEDKLNAYSVTAEKNINETYDKFLACLQSTNDLDALDKCKHLFLDSYVLRRESGVMAIDVYIEEVIAAKKKDRNK